MGKQPKWALAAVGVVAVAGITAAVVIATGGDQAEAQAAPPAVSGVQLAQAPDEAEPDALQANATDVTAAAKSRSVSLILEYKVTKTCTVHPNYPKDGVIGNDIDWQIAPTDIVAWRYNVNSTWSMISDKKYRNSKHPWWGFVHRDCLGTSVGGEHFPTPTSHYPAGEPVPQRILEGRSAVEADHYRTVVFRVAEGHVTNDHRAVKTMGTLRDAANRFVIGNVFGGWHVHSTDQHDHGWTKVYVPNAKRWGWVQDIHLA
ncbi:hypothetical protein [Labedaea rhizosphaerae]|uniref:Uncharacterized protein n=1 Tax=Labedaea rhizosphaerae TaxID=598644 RepID=A0A4R6RUN3_LABRH|nr:hypothetical protein [Labedaea rhizosphaerae]TDP89975.1 hypothetical protein EV186_111101 [Labedaea rhizosphaerae]